MNGTWARPTHSGPEIVGKKKKVRVALKKNRQKRTRANDLTRTYETQGQGKGQGETAPTERVRAKGDLSRHRTIMADVNDEAVRESTDEGSEEVASRRSVDTSSLAGRV